MSTPDAELAYPPEMRDLIAQRTFHRFDDPTNFHKATSYQGDPERVVAELTEAHLVSSESRYTGGEHALLLDIDVPCWLLPSSTAGHNHLYADVRCDWVDYVRFLSVAKDIGLLQPGYVAASMRRGYTSLRPPWVRKAA